MHKGFFNAVATNEAAAVQVHTHVSRGPRVSAYAMREPRNHRDQTMMAAKYSPRDSRRVEFRFIKADRTRADADA